MAVLSGMSFNQLATVLNSIVSQATGKAQITPTNTNEFVSVAKVGLETGYDPLVTAISQVLSRTIFSMRPYSRKFSGLMVDSVRYGNHIRKLQVIDKDFEEDDRIKLVDGQAIDMYKVNKPEVLQTNFYGENVFQKSITIYRDQLDCAFSSPEEFDRFIAMIMQNVSDMIEQAHETVARATLANFIAGKSKCDTPNVVYLLDKYQDDTGVYVTAETVKAPSNFPAFAKWLKGYLTTTSAFMTERSLKYHKTFTINGNAKPIMRHTPYRNQKAYLFTSVIDQIDSSVIADVFNAEYMKLIDHEKVNYWQSIETPQGISVKPSYNAADGSLVASPDSVILSNVFGVLFDEEAIGITTVNQWSATTPFNAKGGYSNIFYHFTDRYWNDFTENGVVLILDHAGADAIGELSLTSVAGTTSGTTKIGVTPSLGWDHRYMYQLDEDEEIDVSYNQVCDTTAGWSAWDGTSDITATNGYTISLVEVDGFYQAKKVGYKVVVSAT